MSKNWLTEWTGSKAAVPVKKAELAVRQDDFARKVAQLRAATGRAETRRARFVCTRTSGQFTVQFERVNPQDKFRIARIEKNQAGGAGGAGAAQKHLAGDDFDTSGFYCAHCNAGDGFVYCSGCGAQVCRGRTTQLPNGADYFRCRDGCDAVGELDTYDKIHAEDNRGGIFTARRPAVPQAPALPTRAIFPALPYSGNVPRLSGPRR